jgi:geranylgeranyl diphosphate synthase type I
MSLLEERAGAYRPAIEREMREVVGEGTGPFFGWIRYHLGWEDRDGNPAGASAGKLMRPVALLLADELCGGRWEDALPAAAAVELVHNFSLLHDDVEDRSDLRRGRPTLWTFAGEAQAINAGDGLFTIARLAMYRLRDRAVPPDRILAAMRELDDACLRLVQGQYLDIAFEEREAVSSDEYVEMAGGKTAAMFAAPFALGAILAGAHPAAVEAFRSFGQDVGLAFQAVDDVLGIWGDPAVTGKPAGDDLRARKRSLPVIAALEGGGEAAEEIARAYATPHDPDEDESHIERLAALIERAGGREAAEAAAQRHGERAVQSLRQAELDDESLALCREFASVAIGRVS